MTRDPHADDHIHDITEAVADRTPVDWTAEPEDEARLRALRAIDRIASVYAGVAADGGGPDGVGSGEPGASGPAAAPGGVAPEPVLFTWKRLRVLEKLGAGTAGEVYRAFDPDLEREVALKLRPASAGAEAGRYLDEARRLARVRHPNVLVVHGAALEDGRVGLWCELLRGRTLEEWLDAHGPLGADEAMVIGKELSRALAAVHAAGLVHGDVKAANVMRREGGGVVLLDFSSVREHPGRAKPGTGTPDGTSGADRITGTPLTLAPEVIAGATPSASSDLYALGALLYRLVSGRYPVPASSWDELIAAHRRGAMVPLRDVRPDLPATFVRVVESALAADPEVRVRSAGEFERALEFALAGGTAPRELRAPAAGAVGTPARMPGAPSADTGRRISWPLGFALFAVAVAALVITPRVMQTRDARAPSGEAAGERGADSSPHAGGVAALPDTPRDAGAGSGAPASGTTPPEARVPALGATPVTTGAVPAPRVRAALFRATEAGREPVVSGDLLRPADQLFLEFEGDRAMHVYVLNEDDAGEIYVLFPAPGLDLENPLAAGTRHRLPGTVGGVSQDWSVTSAHGRETILVIASREPLAPLEQELASLPPVEPETGVRYAELSVSGMEGLRGIGGLAPSREGAGEAGSPEGGRLAELAATYRKLAAARGDIWVDRIELVNPR